MVVPKRRRSKKGGRWSGKSKNKLDDDGETSI